MTEHVYRPVCVRVRMCVGFGVFLRQTRLLFFESDYLRISHFKIALSFASIRWGKNAGRLKKCGGDIVRCFRFQIWFFLPLLLLLIQFKIPQTDTSI